MIDEPDRAGFAYGTLPGHPECGEESFIIERGGDGLLTFTVAAWPRPATRVSRVAGPLAAVLQDRMTGRYLRALDS